LGTPVAQWIRYCAINRKVTGSIPFHNFQHFSASLIMRLGTPGSTVVKVLYYKSEGHWFDSPSQLPAFFCFTYYAFGYPGSTVVKVLCYKSEGRWFDSPSQLPAFFCFTDYAFGDPGSTVVKVLCYKSEGRWFVSLCVSCLNVFVALRSWSVCNDTQKGKSSTGVTLSILKATGGETIARVTGGMTLESRQR